jgi:hypothetical protein
MRDSQAKSRDPNSKVPGSRTNAKDLKIAFYINIFCLNNVTNSYIVINKTIRQIVD